MQETPDSPRCTSWEEFLESHADAIFRVVRLFMDSYDERMDLFLFVCERLRADDMRRIRSFRARPEAPCRFTTYLAVVTRNLALDYMRARDGRFRHFRSVGRRDAVDRLLFEYHVRDGRPIEETRSLLRERHGLRLSAAEASGRAARIESSLTASQRWRVLSRLLARRRPLTIDPVTEVAHGASGPSGTVPLPCSDSDPEEALRSTDAGRVLAEALASLPARQRLAMILRYRDGLTTRDVGRVIDAPGAEAARLAREGLETVRVAMRRSRVVRRDLDAEGLSSWADTGGAGR